MIRIDSTISALKASDWNALDHGDSPFTRHGFWRALEESGSIGEGTGWHPLYISVWEGDTLEGAVVPFVKTHSYGEYIFDWAWADAAARTGIAYYPKLVVMSPVSPVSGRRLLLRESSETVALKLVAAVEELADDVAASSIHWLFNGQWEHDLLLRGRYAGRSSLQFHWHNKDYEDFGDFLESLRSSKRKQVKKERRRAQESMESFQWKRGDELTTDELDRMDDFYRRTCAFRGGYPYLEQGFFHALAKWMPNEMVMGQAWGNEQIIAGALFLESSEAMFGRYWGCSQFDEFMHFECAYYRGIERAIEKGLVRFEAGAQGEHKLLRGFEPVTIRSAHWIRDERLREGIHEFLEHEALSHQARLQSLQAYLPYKRNDNE